MIKRYFIMGLVSSIVIQAGYLQAQETEGSISVNGVLTDNGASLESHTYLDPLDIYDELEVETETGSSLSLNSSFSESTESADLPSWFRNAHFTFSQEGAYGIKNDDNLVMNRSSVRLQWQHLTAQALFFKLDAKAYHDRAFEKSQFSNEVQKQHSNYHSVREAYVQTNLGDLSIKAGKQLVIWGKSDSAVITDVLSPRNLTDLFFTKIEDSRIAQNMLTLDYYRNQSQYTLLIIPDVKVNEFAVPGHPYSTQLSKLLYSAEDNRPNEISRSHEFGFRWNTTLGQWDVSILAANIYANTPEFELNSTQNLQVIYPKYKMIGGGFNVSQGKLVLKGEMAYKPNRYFTQANFAPLQHKNVLNSVLGFDYNNNGSYILSMELSNQYIQNWNTNILNQSRNESGLYTIIRKDFLNDTLSVSYTNHAQLQNFEYLHRFEYSQMFSSNINLTFQLDIFDAHSDTTLFGQMQDNDRIALKIDYDL